MKNNKYLKIISILTFNIILFISLIIVLELYCFLEKVCQCYFYDHQKYPSISAKIKRAIRDTKIFHRYSLPLEYSDFRQKVFKSSNNPAHNIILLGGSFTYGDTLDDKDTFSNVLSTYTNSTVYNLGISGGSIADMLYLVRHKKDMFRKLTQNNKNIDYVIFTYITGHEARVVHPARPCIIEFFITKDKKLVCHEKSIFENRSFLYSKLYACYCNFVTNFDEYYLFDLYINETYEELKKEFNHDFNFVVFLYEDVSRKEFYTYLNKNIKVIRMQDIFDGDINAPQYISYDGLHPNEKVWKTIVPLLAKELNL